MFGIPVRVHPFFWLVAALLGWPWYTHGNFQMLLLWIVCVFISVLIHELGHVVMGQVFGSYGRVLLYSFGGLAIGSSDLGRRWQRILVYFAGPAAQLILLAGILGLWYVADFNWPPYVLITLIMLYEINLIWPLFNLLPIFPLDGGQIAREVLVGVYGTRGLLASLILSGVVAGLLAVHCLMGQYGHTFIPWIGSIGGFFTALFMIQFCVTSFQAYQIEKDRNQHYRDRYRDDRLPWE